MASKPTKNYQITLNGLKEKIKPARLRNFCTVNAQLLKSYRDKIKWRNLRSTNREIKTEGNKRENKQWNSI